MKNENSKSKTAFITIVGKPNVGKSSLVNCLVGEKIAIVSKKPQTTRNRIMGVLTKGETQFVFIDTPGMHKIKNKLGNYMVKSITTSVCDVDFAVLVIEAIGKISAVEERLIESFKKAGIPAVVAINKIDLQKDKTRLIELMAEISGLYDFSAIVPVSAKTGKGIDELLAELDKLSLPGEHLFPDDTLTDQSERVLVSEIIREKFLRFTDKEIPHGIFVAVEKMRERENKEIIDIHATIYCEKESHKAIVIGKNGTMLKKIGKLAREDIERFFSCHVNLQLWVKVKEGWRNRESILRDFGYNEKLLK